MEENLESKISKQIPKRPKVFGWYDDEEEKWRVFSPGTKFDTIVGLTAEEIPEFVTEVIKQLRTLGRVKIEKISFDLVIQGNRIRFSVTGLDKESQKLII